MNKIGSELPQFLPNLYLESGRIDGRSLKWYRQRHGLTQEQLATVLGMARRTIANAEAGRRIARRTNEALGFFVLATRNIIEEHGILPPDLRFDRFFDKRGKYRKDYIKEFLIETEPRVVQLKVKVSELELELQRKDQVIRDLVRSKTKDITGVDREIDRLRNQLYELQRQIEQAVSVSH